MSQFSYPNETQLKDLLDSMIDSNPTIKLFHRLKADQIADELGALDTIQCSRCQAYSVMDRNEIKRYALWSCEECRQQFKPVGYHEVAITRVVSVRRGNE
jgi:ribosomal protein L37AE/L43A